MRAGEYIQYKNELWEKIYVDGTRMGEEVDGLIGWNMIDMFKKGETRRTLKSPIVSGSIELRGNRCLGHFCGAYFTMRGECERGKFNLGTLLTEVNLCPSMN